MPEIIGVQFQRVGKIYYFDSENANIEANTNIIVETSRGVEYARVALATHWVPEEDIVQPLKPFIRVATPEDDAQYEQNLKDAVEAYDICQEKIALCELDMKLVNVEYTFDRTKIIFNFTADERVDFRELIKELASVFHTRIELRQIGVRDEAKIIGGIGICGQPLCCHRFLNDFSPVSIKMAKEQNLSLNPNKISGCCGRLLCCLNYENEHYVESNRLAREKAKEEREAREREAAEHPENAADQDQAANEELAKEKTAKDKASKQDTYKKDYKKEEGSRKSSSRQDSHPKKEYHYKFDKHSKGKDNNKDKETQISVEAYNSHSEEHDHSKHYSRESHDKNTRNNRSKKSKNYDRSNKSRKPKRSYDANYNDEHYEKSEKIRKSRKRPNNHNDYNRNKNNGKSQ